MEPFQHLTGFCILYVSLLRSISGTSDAIASNSLMCASVGQDITLGCFLFPPINAEDVQVTWTQGADEESIVHFYRNGTEDVEKQASQFRGRTRMIRKDITSGKVALTIRNITLSDAGQYFCSFSSNTIPLRTSVRLEVTVTGRSACDLEQELGTVIKERDALIKERDYLQRFKDFQPMDSEWRWARSFAAYITMDPDTVNPRLALSENGRSVILLEDSEQDLPDTPARYNRSPCVLGRERLTSGRHYWEVEVGTVWWELGVCDESVNRKGRSAPSPERGCWAVGLLNGKDYHAFTSRSTHLTPKAPPKAIGVFLDYDAERVTFYDVKEKSQFFSFPSAHFPHILLPYFCTYDSGKHLLLRPLTAQD
ncbi:butyrophilin subfamily 1 member A1-like isoform X1 [Pleurodeles waltl]|uniref:butyrophilin subfamily 1 member A1-like isoform X1 n=1 Tax=Pleurodeles waltl TaxID=8319 RepID=UPI00370974AD